MIELDHTYKRTAVKRGVPYEFILGPLLCIIIYINDLHSSFPISSITQFAGNTSVVSGTNLSDMAVVC